MGSNLLRKLWDIEWKSFDYGQRIYGKKLAEAADEIEVLLGESITDSAYILDAGCGIRSASIELIRRHNIHLFASDISGVAIYNTKKAGLRCFQSDILNLPIKSGKFDISFAHGVLHYVSAPFDSIKELARTVRVGGYIAFSIWPMFPGWIVLAQRFFRVTFSIFPLPIIRFFAYILAPVYIPIYYFSNLQHPRTGFAEATHIMFNMLTAPYINSASRATVTRWCNECGCDVIHFGLPEVRVLAKKRK